MDASRLFAAPGVDIASMFTNGKGIGMINFIYAKTIMRFISTRAHGILDYLMGALLIAAPWVFDFNRGGAETYVPVALGIAAIIYSLFTNYECSIAKTLSMNTHLTLDLASGILLAVAPWLFGFSEYVYVPHLVLGLLEVGASLMTERRATSLNERTSHRTAH